MIFITTILKNNSNNSVILMIKVKIMIILILIMIMWVMIVIIINITMITIMMKIMMIIKHTNYRSCFTTKTTQPPSHHNQNTPAIITSQPKHPSYHHITTKTSQPSSHPRYPNHNHCHNESYNSPSLDEIGPSCDNRFAESCFCLGVVDGGSHGTPSPQGGSEHVQQLVEGDFRSSLVWWEREREEKGLLEIRIEN